MTSPPDIDPGYLDSLMSGNGAADPGAVADRMRLRIVQGLAIARLPRPTWLVDSVIPRPSVGMVYGPPKNGKSFAAIDLAASVATGRTWMGAQCEQGTVVYVIGEGIGGVGARADAWAEYNGIHDLDGIHWHRGPVNLLDPEQVAALAGYCREVGAVLIVLDTLARCTVGADENSARDMGRVIEALDMLRDASGAAVAPQHHTGKDRAKGARGSSALLGAVDWSIEAAKSEDTVRLTVREMKDGPDGATFTWGLQPCGESAVLVPGGGRFAKVPGQVDDVIEALREIATPEGVGASTWKAATDVSERTFYRARKYLVDTARVLNVGTDKRPLYVPATIEERGSESAA